MIQSICAFTILTASLNLLASTLSRDVIYGKDNRKDTYEVKSALHLKLAESTAAMVHKDQIVQRGISADLLAGSLSQMTPPGLSAPVCEKERFSHQPLASICSGFLVADDIIATAGHCMTSLMDCNDYRWVFNYKVKDKHQTAVSVDVKDVYTCKEIIKQGLFPGIDFALIRLDRPLKGKTLKIAKAEPSVGTPLVMIGHPSGLPQKVTDGAKVIQKNSTGFITNLDAFQGNSGSAVFNDKNGELVGILVNGNQDYRHNEELNCSEVNEMEDKAAGEGVSSFKQFISFLR